MIYLTADQHFRHQAIIEYCYRPYKNTNEMEGKLIKEHNKIVRFDDTIYYLGDFAFLRIHQYPSLCDLVNKLNGKKHLILGNHDEFSVNQYLKAGFLSVHSSLELLYNDMKIFLVHDPNDPVVKEYRKTHHILCGHVHDSWKNQNDMLNVGVDVNDYRPLSIENVLSNL